MSPTRQPSPQDERELRAYERMLNRTLAELKKTGQQTGAVLRNSLDIAKEKALEAGELTRAEADRIAGYVQRDLKEVGEYLATSGEDLKSWFQFDMQLIETQLLDMFMDAADQTKLAYLQLADQAQQAAEYSSGEITTVGTLQCAQCGERLHFSATAHIPPCPKCHHTRFVRAGR